MEKQEHNFLESFDLTHTGDVLSHKEQEGRDREKPKINLNDVGIDKASQELFERVRQEHGADSEQGVHHEAGMPLPNKASEKMRAELLNKLIESGEGAPSDQMDELLKNYSME